MVTESEEIHSNSDITLTHDLGRVFSLLSSSVFPTILKEEGRKRKNLGLFANASGQHSALASQPPLLR